MTAAAPVDQLPLVAALPAEHVFDMHVDLTPARAIPTPIGMKLVFITTGGTISGPRVEGEILPGGGDWLLIGADRTGRNDVRATIRTGEVRRAPLLHLERGDTLVVLAANAGAQRTPAWWLNLRDAGVGTVTVGPGRVQVRRRLVEGMERHALWRAFVAKYPRRSTTVNSPRGASR